ncbi:MAG TPA: hypothetical protein DHW11_02395 [Gemmatimonadetes bacterium]|nr:hypothetical protein [Gemmatimonadota bacterium]
MSLLILRPVLVVALLLAFATHAHADRGVAVFGSFSSQAAASSFREQVARDLRIPVLRIVEADVAGSRYYRVTGEESSESSARKSIATARLRGYTAWYLAARPESAMPSPLRSRPDLATRPAPSLATRNATPREARNAPRSVSRDTAVPEAEPPNTESKQQRSWGANLAGYFQTTDAGGSQSPASTPDVSATSPTPAAVSALAPKGAQRIQVERFDNVQISIDGKLDESIWGEVNGYDNMIVTEPVTLEDAPLQTVSRFVATPKGLYVGAEMEQPGDKLIARLSARDQYLNRDAYGVVIDTSGEGLYGYWFTVNLGGSVQDGKVAPERSFSTEWDGPWISDTAVIEGGWSVEMFLPWSMMTMPVEVDERTMGFWVQRKVAYVDQRYGWPALPFTQPKFMSALNTMAVPKVQPKQQWALYPYVTGGADDIREDTKIRAGVDIVWRPTSSLQVTAALNPDFGAVESDDVVVNLSAFETYFAEKRLFFLEGQEVFISTPRAESRQSSTRGSGGRRAPSTFTRTPITLLNTRRVGGAATHVEIQDGISVDGIERSKPTDLLGAVKVVGEVGNFRYGSLAAFEDEVELRGTVDATGDDVVVTASGRDFGAVRGIYEADAGTGRRAIGYLGTLVDSQTDVAHAHGIDTHFRTKNGKFTWDAQTLYSNVDGTTGAGILNDFRYVTRGIIQSLSLDYLDDSIDIGDFGFIRRNDEMALNYNLFKIQSRGLPDYLRQRRGGVFVAASANTDGLLTRGVASYFNVLTLRNNSDLRMFWNYYGPAWDDRNSRGNGIFRTDPRLTGRFSYGTDSARPLSYSIQAGFQGEDTGDVSYSGDIGFTWSPTPRFSMDLDFGYLRRDEWLLYTGSGNLTTFDARNLRSNLAIDYFVTARQQLRLTLQWIGIEAEERNFFTSPTIKGDLVARIKDPSEGVDDFTISRLTAQFRYRWELGPLSDLFVVYTRGSNLPNRTAADFEDLFLDALSDPIVDALIIKLRYRFGS